jgi:amidase
MSNHASTINDTTSPTPRLRHATLLELARGLEHGSYTSRQLVAAYKARINEVNNECNAVIETAPEAIENARLLDLERRLRGSRSSLHGIPILLKDNIPTLDSTGTACGSSALVGAQ